MKDHPIVHFEIGSHDGEKAVELGGKTLVPPVPIPGQGSFAWLGSPEGHIVGIWKPE